jgi:hypothetical protein
MVNPQQQFFGKLVSQVKPLSLSQASRNLGVGIALVGWEVGTTILAAAPRAGA